MPIRPETRHLYPPRAEWARIRRDILERAGNACECRGECELVEHNGGRCAAPNGQIVERSHTQTPGFIEVEFWRAHEHDGACCGGECGGRRVVLTIAHLDHDPTNNDPANLRAWCQRCHLRYDRHEHAKNARATRDRKSGQGRLL